MEWKNSRNREETKHPGKTLGTGKGKQVRSRKSGKTVETGKEFIGWKKTGTGKKPNIREKLLGTGKGGHGLEKTVGTVNKLTGWMSCGTGFRFIR